MSMFEIIGNPDFGAGDRSTKIAITGASLMFKNFAGVQSAYNAAGARNFCVLIDNDDFARTLSDAGFNVKQWVNRTDPEVPPTTYIKVNVSYRFRKPRIVVINNGKMDELDEDVVDMIDNLDIESCDIILNPSHWSRPNGDSGITAYLEELYVTVRPSYFGEKYRNHSSANFVNPPSDIPGDMPFEI